MVGAVSPSTEVDSSFVLTPPNNPESCLDTEPEKAEGVPPSTQDSRASQHTGGQLHWRLVTHRPSVFSWDEHTYTGPTLGASVCKFFSSIPGKLAQFWANNKEDFVKGAKLLTGASLVILCSTAMPSLILTVAQLAITAFSENMALMLSAAKITGCTLGLLSGISLIRHATEQPPVTPPIEFH